MSSPTPMFEEQLITIRLESQRPDDETELKAYLEDALGIKVMQEFRESAHWTPPILLIRTVGIPVALYAGKKLIDVIFDLLKDWLKRKPNVSEIVLYDADGKVIKIPRK